MGRLFTTLAKAYFTNFPIERGKWRAWTILNPRMSRTYYKSGEHVTKHGFKMYLDPQQYIDRFIYIWGLWEPDESYVIKKFLRPGDTFVDVGANAGYFTLLASGLVGNTGKVYAFEPVPPTVDKLKRNINLNNATNIIVHNYAACDCKGTVKIAKRGVGNVSGQNSMRFDERSSEHWEAPAVRLDTVIPPQELIRLIKIDVEGAELLALKGLKQLLDSDNGPMVLCEVTDSYLKELGATAQELYQFMEASGYRYIYDCHNRRFSPMTAKTLSDNHFQLNLLFSKNPIN